MAIDNWIICFMLFSCLFRAYEASDGNSDPSYRACVGQCEETGCIGSRCFSHCQFSSNESSVDDPSYMQKTFYLQLKQWYCQSDCQFHCMGKMEKERTKVGLGPAKYNGKWLFWHFYCFQEPVSVVLSVLNLALHYHGWSDFHFHIHYKLPPRRDMANRRPFYDYRGLWTIYAFLSMNSCLWAAVYHSRDMYLTKMLDCFSGLAILGYSLIFALIRSLGITDNAARVMVAAPLLAFTTTHILYLNNYQINYAWHAKVCGAMNVLQLLTWSIWGSVSRHPSRMKLWMAVVVGSPGLLLQMYDFPPYKGLVDAHTLLHAAAFLPTCIWWSFAKSDAEHRTVALMKKAK